MLIEDHRREDYDEGYERGWEMGKRGMPSELEPSWYGHGDDDYCAGYSAGYSAGERRRLTDTAI